MKTDLSYRFLAVLSLCMLLSFATSAQQEGTKNAKPDPDSPTSITGRSAPSAYKWANKKTKLDKDGDGIPDALETTPINFGGVLVTLDPEKKDVILVVDFVGTDNANLPTVESLAILLASFNSAPVKGLKGKTGIALHLVSIGSGYPLPSNSSIGTIANDEYDWSQLDTIKQNTIAANNLGSIPHIYHYCLSCNNYGGSGSSGISRNGISTYSQFRSGAVDSICSLQGYQSSVQAAGMTAGTIMHEFGHNLGLTHGGYDHVNYKPNYISIMNYHFQFDGITVNGAHSYDYSRVLLKPLDERKIKEKAGLGSKAKGLGTQFSYQGYQNPFILTGDLTKNVDWNFDGIIEKQAYPWNLNYPFDVDLTWLVSEKNWDNINFTGGGNIGGAVANSNVSDLVNQNYEGRFTKVPDNLKCRELTDADKLAIETSQRKFSVEEILGPGVKMKITKSGNLTLYTLEQ